MALIKWRPWPDMFDEIDDFFDNAPRRTLSRSFAPAMNISQDGGTVIVEAPLPGIEPEKVDISIENDVLTIQGRDEKKHEIEEKDYTRREWSMQSFHRSVALPVSVQSDKAEAEYANGVLKITIPKREDVKTKKVNVKVK